MLAHGASTSEGSTVGSTLRMSCAYVASFLFASFLALLPASDAATTIVALDTCPNAYYVSAPWVYAALYALILD